MKRAAAVVAVVGVVLAGSAVFSAEEGARKKPIGTWERQAGDTQIRFEITADRLRVSVKGSETTTVECDYGVTRDGVLFGVVDKVEKQGEGGPSKGDLFSFKFSVDKDTLTVSELKGTDNADAKQAVEGEYKKAGK